MQSNTKYWVKDMCVALRQNEERYFSKCPKKLPSICMRESEKKCEKGQKRWFAEVGWGVCGVVGGVVVMVCWSRRGGEEEESESEEEEKGEETIMDESA